MGKRAKGDGGSSTLVERVYQATRASILDGTYAPNSWLRVNSVATSNAVSLIPVREAMRLLEAERLIETIPNKGARVAPISVSDLVDSYQARAVIETAALRLAAPNLSVERLESLRTIVEKMVGRFDADDLNGGLELHREVHFALYEPAESPWLLHMIEMLWAYTERFRRLATELHQTNRQIGDNHLAILDPLAKGETDAAVDALAADLRDTEQHLIAAFERGDLIAAE